MMSIKFGKGEQTFADLQDAFNEISQRFYPECLEWDHYELWKNANKIYTPADWKDWRLDARVDDWYQSEILIITQNRAIKLLRKAGDSRSVAESSALRELNAYVDKHRQTAKQETIFYYCFIPLNTHEEASENVKILQNVPAEIENAIIRPKRSHQK